MSYGTPFTTEEEKEFKDLEFRRRRADALDFFNRGVPMSARQQEWLEVQRQRAQQPAWAAAEESAQNTSQNSKTYTNGGPPYSYAEPDYQYPGASEGPGPKAAYSESTYSGYGTTYSQLDEQPKDGAPPNVVENAMTKLGSNLRDIRMHSRRNGWKGLVATLDTGTEENWICRNKVDQLNLHIKGGNNVKCITFDGQEFSSGEVVQPTWGVEGQSKSYVTVFRIAPREAPFDVLFGRNFLASGEVDFDSEESAIQIGVTKKINHNEKKTIDQNEANHSAYRPNDASIPHPVKRDKTDKKSTSKSPTKSSRNVKGQPKQGSN